MAESKPPTQIDPPDYGYSELEVQQPSTLEVQQHSTLEVQQHSTLEFDNKQDDDTHKEANAVGFTPTNGVLVEGRHPPPPKVICGIRRRICWILAGILAVCVIVGAVVGGVVGSRKGNSDKATVPPTGLNSNYTTPATRLAYVASQDADGGSFRHIFYQTSGAIVHEHAWNSSARVWAHLSDLGSARLDTPIAAAATLYSSLNIELLSGDDFLLEIWAQNPNDTDGKWKQGGLTDMNVKVLDNTDMACTWSGSQWCENCNFGLHLFFQNETGALMYGNSSTKWTIKEASAFPSPRNGTPIAVTRTWQLSNNETDIMVFYEKEDGSIVQVQWNGLDQVDDNAAPGIKQTSINNGTSRVIDLAAFAYTPATSREYILGLLVSGENGITSYIKTENDTEWISSIPTAMRSLDPGTPVAANGDGHAYGIGNGTIKEFVISFSGQSWDWTEGVAVVDV